MSQLRPWQMVSQAESGPVVTVSCWTALSFRMVCLLGVESDFLYFFFFVPKSSTTHHPKLHQIHRKKSKSLLLGSSG